MIPSSASYLEKLIQWDSLQNRSNSQGKLMRFRCSENHVCTSHNKPVTFYRITNRVGDQVSLFTICLEMQNIFSAGTFSPVIISLRKVRKELHNIVVSHMLTLTVCRVIAVQCETLNESCLRSQTTLKEENNTCE